MNSDITDAGALRIFRDVWAQYEALIESGRSFDPKVSEFIADFDGIVKKVLDNNDLATYKACVHPFTRGEPGYTGRCNPTLIKQIMTRLGRGAATAGLWPTDEYFNQSSPRSAI